MTESAPWNPDQYHMFAQFRGRAGHDLIAHLRKSLSHRAPRKSARIVDLGCGTGELTRELAARLAPSFPRPYIMGLDNSASMLARAAHLPDAIHWQEGDIGRFATDQHSPLWDVVFSNAALHWVPEPETLWPRLMFCLAPQGLLAVQIPLADAPWRAVIRNVVNLAPWAGILSRELRPEDRGVENGLDPALIYTLLEPLARNIDMWQTIYWHPLSGEDPLLAWLESTTLRPILNCLAPPMREDFCNILRSKLEDVIPKSPAGAFLFAFPRLFVIAERH